MNAKKVRMFFMPKILFFVLWDLSGFGQTTSVLMVPESSDISVQESRLISKGMILVQGGSFHMGDCFQEGEEDERPLHPVIVKSFYLGRFEVTFAEYDFFCQVIGKSKPEDEGWGRERRPVINITWYDAAEYCNWRSDIEGLTACYRIDGDEVRCDFSANGYRLPIEAEWEYAAREGGRLIRFGNGKNVADPKEMNFDSKAEFQKPYSIVGECSHRTSPVGSFESNDLGLYDMSGNVAELCWDSYDKDCYSRGESDNPTETVKDGECVRRGGSWGKKSNECRCSYRSRIHRNSYSPGTGFRLARSL